VLVLINSISVRCTVDDLTESTLAVVLPKLWDSSSGLCFDDEGSHDHNRVADRGLFIRDMGRNTRLMTRRVFVRWDVRAQLLYREEMVVVYIGSTTCSH
jgi:hypothetical protein